MSYHIFPVFKDHGFASYPALYERWLALGNVVSGCARSVSQSCLTLQRHGLWPTRLLSPWSFPDKNTGEQKVLTMTKGTPNLVILGVVAKFPSPRWEGA